MVARDTFLVIMAGGSGTRFWPKSTSLKPKQLLSIKENESTLLENTLDRFSELVEPSQRWIVTTQKLTQPTIKALEGRFAKTRVLSEPQARNTAPCVFWAAKEVIKQDPNGIMLVMPADHLITDRLAFYKTLSLAIEQARTTGDLVTLGVKPTRPETGYGYLKLGAKKQGYFDLEAFVEKPDLQKAQQFIQSGKYLWNGGMFVWKAKSILAAFDQHMPELEKAWSESRGDVTLAYPRMTATSIDFGVMEKAKNVVTFELDCGWDDLGSWTSLESISKQMGLIQEKNTVGGGQVLAIDSVQNIVDAPGKVIALLGVKDLIIVQSGDVLLVADKNKAQDIKAMVELAKSKLPQIV